MATQREHDDYSDKKYRKTLNTTIINNFLDLERISTCTSNNSTLSDFFHHMRNSFKELPHIFVNCLTADVHDTQDLSSGHSTRKEDDYLSTAFTEWIMMWLLRVLSQPCTVVHKECKQLLYSLLQLVKIHNPCFFREYVMRIIALLTELSEMVEKFINENASSITIQNYFKSDKRIHDEFNIRNSQELELIDISIVFSSPNECESLAEKVTSILEILMSDIIQFLPDHCCVLCNQLCTQIELGGLPLKIESILSVTSLIKNNGLMIPTNLANYLFSCLRSIIAFCCDFEEPVPETFNLLENSTALLLEEITKKYLLHLNKYTISVSTLGKVLQTLTEVIFKSRFFSVDDTLQVAVVKGIICFTKHGSNNGYLLPLNIQRQFTQALIDLVAIKNSKGLIPLAVHMITMDKVVTSDKSRSVSRNYVIEITSPSWSLLYEAMIEKLNSNISETASIEAVCCSMEILLWSYYEIILRRNEVSEIKALLENFSKTFSMQILDSFNRLVKNNLFKIKSTSQFESIVKVYQILLFVQDKSLRSEQWLMILNVLSVPFISKSGSVLDLWCEFLPPNSIKRLEISHDTSIKSKCLKLLFFVPTHVSDKWKTKLFLDSLCYDDLKMSSVSTIPHFLYASPCPSIVLPEVVQSLTNAQSIAVLKEISKIFGLMCCTFSGTCSLVRENSTEDFIVNEPQLKCMKCKKENTCEENEQKLASPPDSLSELVFYLLNHSSEYVRREILQNILSYFSHFKITENVLSTVLHCIVDTDSIVRTKFSGIVYELLRPVFVTKLNDNSRQGIEEMVIMNIQAALLMSKQSESIPFQRTVVYTIGEVGKLADSGLLLIVIISLLESSLSSTPSVKVVAYTKLKQIGESKKLKMHDLLKSYKDAICKFLAEFLSKNPADMNKILFVLEEIRVVFEYDDLKSFIQQTQHFILPYLIVKEMAQPSILIQALASVLDTDKREILINNFPFIFSHFVRQCSKAELEMALTFMQKETGLELGSLLRCYYQPVHNELLLHLSTHHQQVLAGLTILAMKSGDVKGMDIMNHGDAMANYLQPKLLGFLVFFDAQMLKSSLDDKKVVGPIFVSYINTIFALESLISIMKMMGSRAVTAVRYKLMATLRLALRFREGNFSKICCKAWSMFVSSIEMYCLGPLLNQIIVALLPLLNSEPHSVAEIFRYLIIEKRAVLNDFFHDLYFVPDTPELQDVNAVLKNYNETPSSLTDFCSLMCHSLKGISHENLEVRLHAIEKLKQVLQGNQRAIHEHLHGRESVDNLISNLVSALITGCRESDDRIRTALGDCLGELGAIDPGRLDMKSVSSKETTNFYNTIDDEKFACALIYKLVHSFLAAEQSGIQDCSACAIQEVLKYYKCSNERGSSGIHLWECFPPDIQEILGIMSHSQYKPLPKTRKKFPVPIYQSKAGSTFKDWTKNWFYSLLQKVKKENPFKLFHACSIIVKYDLSCTLFLLPHLVIYVLLDSTEIEKNEICTEILTVLRESHQSSTLNDMSHLSSQTIFSIVDHLVKWSHHYLQELVSKISTKQHNQQQIVQKVAEDKNLKAINGCLSSIPQILLAKSAFACQAYARALMHMEKHVKEFPDQLKYNINFIQKIYAALDDPEGVAGIAAIRKEEPSLTDLILENEAIGDMQAAFACYEKAIKLYPNEPSYHGGLLRCFLGMDQPTTAISYANGILTDRPEWKDDLNSFRIEAAWKLANWDNLELYLDEEQTKAEWPVGIGNILHLANKKDLENYEKYANIIRNSQMAPLSAASMEKGAYLRGYEYLVRMHMLTDLQQCADYIFDMKGENNNPSKGPLLFDEILPNLSLRRTLLQTSSRYQEPVHNLHRVLLKIGKEKMPDFSSRFDQEIAKCWLQSARLARKNGYYQRAYNCLLEAGTISSAEYFMEKTKWLWSKGEKEQAIYCLQKGISEHFLQIHINRVMSSSSSTEEYLMCGKAKLLLAIYSEESSIVDSNSLIEMYKEVVNLQSNWEASHFHLAKYIDKILNTTEAMDAKADLMLKVVLSFGASLKHGCKNVYHSLPRLLDIWFDLATLQADESASSSIRKTVSWRNFGSVLEKITLTVKDLYETIPLYTFMTAFPQLISRICHSHPAVSGPLQKLISRLLVSYPQQSIWMMMAVSKSSYATRSKRCKQIVLDATNLNPNLVKFISDTTRLADKLIELSNKNVGEANKLSINENFSSLSKLIEEKNFSKIMLPSQTQMIVTLPNGFICNVDHNPFPFTPVYIRGFEDTVDVFPSLQKPKKLIVKGSDGKLYPIMCKPKDDLRKDCRLMEFNNLVNRYLKSDPEARRRQLYIRTYAVVPLNEECGLIEWVPNLHGLRLILSRLYKLKSMSVSGRDIRAMMPSKTATYEEKLNIFKNKFLPRFPPVFHEWFMLTFSDPTAWYHARLAYARTAAVMSMVGYIVGLGDRHGENILFDSSCGDVVHVDLNCLFNKGETMECPECVPFRLTHNMVDAMGPNGYEGAFRKACEVTMRVMRSKTDALMSVLRPFVHDPLVEWSRSRAKTQHESGEITNEQGLTHVKDIELRLNGIIKYKNKKQGLPLSIEGQVNHLIQEAVDIKNLSQMYIGWAAYM